MLFLLDYIYFKCANSEINQKQIWFIKKVVNFFYENPASVWTPRFVDKTGFISFPTNVFTTIKYKPNSLK